MEHISLLIVIENDPLQRDSLLFEVVRGQRHTVDRAESRVRDHQTPKTAGFDYLRQADIRLIKAERTRRIPPLPSIVTYSYSSQTF